MGRAATSSIQTPASLTRISACTGPCVKPRARDRTLRGFDDRAWIAGGSRDGVR